MTRVFSLFSGEAQPSTNVSCTIFSTTTRRCTTRQCGANHFDHDKLPNHHCFD